MTRRSDAQRTEMLDTLRPHKLSKKETKAAETLAEMLGVRAAADTTELLIHRFLRAEARDRAGTSIPDGYPRGSGFDAGRGGQHKVDADMWEGESTIALTSVELAIEHRLFQQKTVKDHHRELTRAAEDFIARAVDALCEAKGALDRLENLIDVNPDQINAEKGCRSHDRLKDGLGRPYYEPIARECGGRDGLCRWCYGWAAEHDGQLPPVELVERFIRNGRVTSRDIEEVAKATARRSA